MLAEFKLSKLFRNAQAFRVSYRDGDLIKHKMIKLEPGKVYQTHDRQLLASFSRFKSTYPINTANRKFLEENNIEYKEEPCTSCGGKVLKFVAQHVIIDEN